MATEDKKSEETPQVVNSRFSELDELQREIALRIKDNQRFLEGFLTEDYVEDVDEDEDEDSDFEEL